MSIDSAVCELLRGGRSIAELKHFVNISLVHDNYDEHCRVQQRPRRCCRYKKLARSAPFPWQAAACNSSHRSSKPHSTPPSPLFFMQVHCPLKVLCIPILELVTLQAIDTKGCPNSPYKLSFMFVRKSSQQFAIVVI